MKGECTMKVMEIEELRSVHKNIRNKGMDENLYGNEVMLLDAIKRILELANLARLEGLLILDEEVMKIELDSDEEVLRQLCLMMLDGMEPELLAEIGRTRYYSNNLQGYRALRYMMYIEGVLSIQAGENPRVLEEKLKSMLPQEMYLEYTRKQEQEELKLKNEKKEHLIENLCKAECKWNPAEKGYYEYKLLDYTICDMKNRDLQKVMSSVTNMELALAMKRMSGNARKHIFDNLSERLGIYVAEDMIEMGPVLIADVLNASQKILNIIVALVDNGEISGRYDYLEPFYSVFKEDTSKDLEEVGKLSQLKEMIEEYEAGSRTVREFKEGESGEV